MSEIGVLLINLGHGTKGHENVESQTTIRQNETLEFMKKTATEYSPDLVLFQEGTSKEFLRNLTEALENNVPNSRFYLPHPSELGRDLIGVIINEEKLEQEKSCNGKSLDVHRAQALAYLRESNQNFLTEDKRAMVV